MRKKDLLKELHIPYTYNKKFDDRCKKNGIEINNDEISEEDAKRILSERKAHICLNDMTKEHLGDIDESPARVLNDVKRTLSVAGVKVLRHSDTLYSFRPGMFYIQQSDIALLEDVMSDYKQTVKAGKTFEVPKTKRNNKKQVKKVDEQDDLENVQRKNYMGFNHYLSLHEGWEQRVRVMKHRENARFYLEDHPPKDVELIPAKDIIFENPKNNHIYIRKADVEKLDKHMEEFFGEYGLSEKEKFSRVVSINPDRKESFELFKEYLLQTRKEIKPHVVEAAKLISGMKKEVTEASTEDVMFLAGNASSIVCKELLCQFFNWIRTKVDVDFAQIKARPSEKKKVKGYSLDEYWKFCKLVFYEKHIQKEGMLEKALSDIRYAGMWIYHSSLATMNLRGTDIEKIAGFLYLDSDPNWLPHLPRDAEMLAEMICGNKVHGKDYLSIGNWFMKRMKYEPLEVNKTHLGEVVARITPSLLTHFGRLLLIGEVHRMRGDALKVWKEDHFQEQYLDVSVQGTFYNGRLKMKSFYGEGIVTLFGRSNFQRVRMNHTISQLEEETGKAMGLDALTALTIASYSRGHVRLGTMLHYVGDHNLTGEDASVVLWTMMERQVLGAIPYLALMTLYPDSFGKLSRDEQTEIMNLSGLSAYDIETVLGQELQMKALEDAFRIGNETDAVAVFKSLLAIGQGYGASMDEGCYCMLRARGYKCPRKDVGKSCLVADCKYNLLTGQAIPTLIRIVEEKEQEALKGDPRAEVLLEQRLYPKLNAILTYIKSVSSSKVMEAIGECIRHYEEEYHESNC